MAGMRMRRIAALVFALCIGVAGCAGRTPNPVQSYQYGDDKKSCNTLKAEISSLEAEIAAKIPDSNKTGSNVALGVAGVFLIVPWFFMDFSKADQVEVEALRRRYNSLVLIASEKSCWTSLCVRAVSG